MNQTTSKSLNGVNVNQLMETIQVVKKNPEIAQFTFRATNQWIQGGNSQTSIQSFYGAAQEDTSRSEAFTLIGDEPAVLLGSNKGPNAVEAILHALASCLAVGIAYNAAAMNIELKSLSFKLNGDLDLHAFLGLSEEKRAGFKNINVNIHAETSASEEQFSELVNHVIKTSPVMDIITNPVPVAINF